MVKYRKSIVDYIIRNLPTDNSDYMSNVFPTIENMDDDSYPIKLLNALRRMMTLFIHDLPPCLQYSDLPLQKFEKETKQACDVVFNAYKYSASGQRDRAFQLIYSFYFESGLFAYLLEDISPQTKLYRMRASNSYNLYTDSEMFHIPFEKSHLTENYRFSISGLPLLYFGSRVSNLMYPLCNK